MIFYFKGKRSGCWENIIEFSVIDGVILSYIKRKFSRNFSEFWEVSEEGRWRWTEEIGVV